MSCSELMYMMPWVCFQGEIGICDYFLTYVPNHGYKIYAGSYPWDSIVVATDTSIKAYSGDITIKFVGDAYISDIGYVDMVMIFHMKCQNLVARYIVKIADHL